MVLSILFRNIFPPEEPKPIVGDDAEIAVNVDKTSVGDDAEIAVNVDNTENVKNDQSAKPEVENKNDGTILIGRVRTTLPELQILYMQDTSFFSNWVYVDWILSQTPSVCSTDATKLIVLLFAIIATMAYISIQTDGRALKPVLLKYFPDQVGNHKKIALIMGVLLDDIPQILVTIVGEREVVGLCQMNPMFSTFSSQAVVNITTSLYNLGNKILNIYYSKEGGKNDKK